MDHARLDQINYAVSALLQLAALFFAAKMAREVHDRRPWIILFAALFIMFAYRVTATFIAKLIPEYLGPMVSVPISLLLFIALFFIRRVAMAERESRLMAQTRTTERDEIENRYRSLVELSPDVLFVTSGGKIVYLNDAAMKFFGATNPSQLLGRMVIDFVAEESRPLIKVRLERLISVGNSAPPVVQQWHRLDGRLVPVEAASVVVPWHGSSAIQVILRDISERVRAENEKTELLISERAARSTAERASRMKDEFLATLSHELRTPLNAILGWSQILRRGPRTADDLSQGLDTIERNARVQTQLIEDLLDMSRIIAGKLRLDVQKVSPIAQIEAAIETVLPAAQAKGIRLEPILDPLAGPISGDPHRLQQIVWNLLSNAIKFTGRGGKVQVLLKRINSHVEISVIDTGQGIPAEFLPFVFDRFRQADGSTTRKQGGLGLGLAIVKQLAELHGGNVHVASPGEDQGATFVVELPIVAVHAPFRNGDDAHPGMYRPDEECKPVSLRGICALVVDDEPDAVELIRRMLQECEAKVITADSAAHAMALIHEQKPDVLISDIGMPEKDGFEFLHDIRGLPAERGGNIPAVALTAFARSEDRIKAMMAGYQVHIAKPVEAQELVATVASLVGRARVV